MSVMGTSISSISTAKKTQSSNPMSALKCGQRRVAEPRGRGFGPATWITDSPLSRISLSASCPSFALVLRSLVLMYTLALSYLLQNPTRNALSVLTSNTTAVFQPNHRSHRWFHHRVWGTVASPSTRQPLYNLPVSNFFHIGTPCEDNKTPPLCRQRDIST